MDIGPLFKAQAITATDWNATENSTSSSFGQGDAKQHINKTQRITKTEAVKKTDRLMNMYFRYYQNASAELE